MINHNLNINNVSNKEKKEINSGIRSPKVADLNVGTNDPTYIYRFSSSVNRKDGENRDPEKQKLGAWWISSSDFLKIESEYLKHLATCNGDKSIAFPLGWFARRAEAIRQEWSNVDILIRAKIVADAKVFKGIGTIQYREAVPHPGNGTVSFTWVAWKNIEQIFIPNLDANNVGYVESGKQIFEIIDHRPISSYQIY